MKAAKNKRRAAACNRLKGFGYPSVREIKRRYEARCGEPVSLAEVADVLLKLEDAAVAVLGGKARLTGKTRTFGKAIAAEIRCAGCGQCFWETGLPYALCIDCRK